MTENITIPYNDVFFYGVTLNTRETNDIKNDIYANIIMRYLRSLSPVANRLYRVAEGNKYEYNYSFVPSQPLSWRVIKNRRIIEEIEYLSDGKYCLNYYDDAGKDIKRVIFSSRHTWLKTNYYNSIYGDNLVCSLVPKEHNGETVILMYPTGVVYPETYYCLKKPSCDTVYQRVMMRSPSPEVSALTNYGVMHFACEETANIYHQLLSEEEAKYAEETKPEVFTTEEDMAGGFNFDIESFSENAGSVFNLSEALVFGENPIETETAEEPQIQQTSDEIKEADDADIESIDSFVISVDAEEPYSLEKNITGVIDIIESMTDIRVDSEAVFSKPEEIIADADESKDEEALDLSVPSVSDESADEVMLVERDEDLSEENTASENSQTDNPETVEPIKPNDMFEYTDDDIDDYVRTLIDSLLVNAKNAVNEYQKGAEDNFESDISEKQSTVTEKSVQANLSQADKLIDNSDEKYFFFGEYTESGRNGRGKTLMENGFTAYEGDYLDDKRHGKGAFYYRSGDLCYFGDWAENKREGFGMGVSSDTGIAHIGKWHDNKPSGLGVRFDRNGNFLYLDTKSHAVNGGIRVTGFTDTSVILEVWDEATLKTVRKEISVEDLLS